MSSVLFALWMAFPSSSTFQTAEPGPNGYWASEGYGLMVTIEDSSLVIHELTAISCLAQPDALVRLPDEDGHRAYGASVDGEPSILVLSGDAPERKRLRRPGTASDILVRRITAPPQSCASPPAATPTAMLELFIRTWEEHYILFDQKMVDWSALAKLARARVTDASTPRELFDMLAGLITPFEDVHTGLSAPELGSVRGARAGTDAVIPGGIEALAANGPGWFFAEVAPHLFAPTNEHLNGPLRRFCNDQVQFALIGDDVGYLRLLSFSGYADGGYRADRRCLDDALDSFFAELVGFRGMVIDVRVNFGGDDPLGLAIAERLATTEYTAYRKEARADPSDRTKWTPGQPSVVRPSARPGFRGPVVELTGPLTISAGETFTQALMGRVPKIARVGEHTQGVFSDVLSRHLPNGWRFWLPNEVFRDAEGRTFDGPGIPPTDPVPVFAPADVAAGRDPGLERALALLPASRRP
ncbi:MAG TPA: S41 family peptidase [Vicinamibacteria bacterium]|nr:S41 family peptidase [Vicinamibacteria bacterium]